MLTVKVYIPQLDTILLACEGTGDNLLKEDFDEGYVDYVYIETQEFNGWRFEDDSDGGMMLMTEYFADVYEGKPEKLAHDAVAYMFGDVKYIMLNKEV